MKFTCLSSVLEKSKKYMIVTSVKYCIHQLFLFFEIISASLNYKNNQNQTLFDYFDIRFYKQKS